MLCDPLASVEVVKAALPEESVPVPIWVVPSKKFTLPVGVRLLLPITVAEKVTLLPAVAGLRELVTLVVVVAASITSVNTLEVEAALLASPP